MDFAIRDDLAPSIAERLRAQEDQRVFNALHDESVSLDQFVTTVNGVSDAADATALTYETLRRTIDQLNRYTPATWDHVPGTPQGPARAARTVREEPTLREIWND